MCIWKQEATYNIVLQWVDFPVSWIVATDMLLSSQETFLHSTNILADSLGIRWQNGVTILVCNNGDATPPKSGTSDNSRGGQDRTEGQRMCWRRTIINLEFSTSHGQRKRIRIVKPQKPAEDHIQQGLPYTNKLSEQLARIFKSDYISISHTSQHHRWDTEKNSTIFYIVVLLLFIITENKAKITKSHNCHLAH